MKILRFDQFTQQQITEGAIPVYKGNSVNAEKSIKSTSIISELEDALNRMKNGELQQVSVVAQIPTQGKRAPSYLKDVLVSAGVRPGHEEDFYNDRGEEKNIFIDSEFIVKSLNMENGSILATPYSLQKKGVEVSIDPSDVIEIFYK